MRWTFARRLSAALAALLLAYGAAVALLAWHLAVEREQETLQRVSVGLARHIVERWPVVSAAAGLPDVQAAARASILTMLMTVNPGIQAYLLDAQGQVQNYFGEPGMVRAPQVDLAAVRVFLTGQAALPLYGSDPMGGPPRVFSAAMFPPRPGDSHPPGYLYIVLEGPAREAVLARLSEQRLWRGLAVAVAAALLATLLIGVLVTLRLARPLQRLAQRMGALELPTLAMKSQPRTAATGSDEVAVITRSFEALQARLARQVAAQREVIANVAHDLRTPLTALQGQLEALAVAGRDPASQRHLSAALAQNHKLRRLTEQLFELATLQSLDEVPVREPFRLDELVADAVQKFDAAGETAIRLGPAPVTAVQVQGDLLLVERAVTNLIDNALRHAGAPVRVSLEVGEAEAAVLVEDDGPGLPAALAQRLNDGEPVRDPALHRHRGGGMGGLGLAIAQRVAALHGGRLRCLPAPRGGTRLALSLPLAPDCGNQKIALNVTP